MNIFGSPPHLICLLFFFFVSAEGRRKRNGQFVAPRLVAPGRATSSPVAMLTSNQGLLTAEQGIPLEQESKERVTNEYNDEILLTRGPPGATNHRHDQGLKAPAIILPMGLPSSTSIFTTISATASFICASKLPISQDSPTRKHGNKMGTTSGPKALKSRLSQSQLDRPLSPAISKQLAEGVCTTPVSEKSVPYISATARGSINGEKKLNKTYSRTKLTKSSEEFSAACVLPAPLSDIKSLISLYPDYDHANAKAAANHDIFPKAQIPAHSGPASHQSSVIDISHRDDDTDDFKCTPSSKMNPFSITQGNRGEHLCRSFSASPAIALQQAYQSRSSAGSSTTTRATMKKGDSFSVPVRPEQSPSRISTQHQKQDISEQRNDQDFNSNSRFAASPYDTSSLNPLICTKFETYSDQRQVQQQQPHEVCEDKPVSSKTVWQDFWKKMSERPVLVKRPVPTQVRQMA